MRVDSPQCPVCNDMEETIHHFLFNCLAWIHERWCMAKKLGKNAKSLAHIVGGMDGMEQLSKFIVGMGSSRTGEKGPTISFKGYGVRVQQQKASADPTRIFSHFHSLLTYGRPFNHFCRPIMSSQGGCSDFQACSHSRASSPYLHSCCLISGWGCT